MSSRYPGTFRSCALGQIMNRPLISASTSHHHRGWLGLTPTARARPLYLPRTPPVAGSRTSPIAAVERALPMCALREHGAGPAGPPLLSFPSLRLHHTVGEEKHEHHTGQIVDEVFGVHETATQAIEMLDEGKIANRVADRRVTKDVSQSAQQPDQDQQTEAEKRRYDLVLGQGGSQDTGRKEHGAQERQCQISGEDRIPVETTEQR